MGEKYGRTPSGCAISGFINTDGRRVTGEAIVESMSVMRERCNGLGAGYAAYGIYPRFREHYALHLMYDSEAARKQCEEYLAGAFEIDLAEPIPTRPVVEIGDAPLLWRYFAVPGGVRAGVTPDDRVTAAVMHVNGRIPGAFVASSGKNMGAFKGVGFPVDIGRFYRLDEYEAHTWIGHGRFPTNTPGWWGGAHPFGLLDWSVVHNGEISSYGTNRRYLEMFGYRCALQTDTEVIAYLFDLLCRRHRLPLECACAVAAPPFWGEIDSMDAGRGALVAALRQVYAAAMLNGPFSVIIGYSGGIIGLNDRIKLRPMVAASSGETVYIASEESAIAAICSGPARVWAPRGGEPVIARLRGEPASALAAPPAKREGAA